MNCYRDLCLFVAISNPAPSPERMIQPHNRLRNGSNHPMVERLRSSPYIADVTDESLDIDEDTPRDGLTGTPRRVRCSA